MRPALLRTTMALLLAAPLAASAQQADVVFAHQFESGAASLSPGLVFVPSFATSTGLAGPLLLQLDEPATVNTFVPIVSLAPDHLTVENGGVTVLQGEDSAVVTMTGLTSDPTPVLVRASLGNQVYASVRVFDDDDPREVVSLRPNPVRIAPGGQRTLIATLNLPAASTGTAINLSVAPLGAGSFTTPITVAANSFSQSFVYTDNNISEFATLSASAGTPPVLASIQQSPIGKLVINEVDFGQTGFGESFDFIEVFNQSPDVVDLSGLAVVISAGTVEPTNLRYNLSNAADSIMPGQFLMISDGVWPGAEAALHIDSGLGIPNEAEVGVAVVDFDAQTVLDALSYGGSLTGVEYPGISTPINFVEGTATTAIDHTLGSFVSLSRMPNGTDTDNAVSDWVEKSRSPGLDNSCTELGLVINEVDYDQSGTDSISFIEIFNPSCNIVSLNALAVVLVNGNDNTEYSRFNLSTAGASLTAGQYLVIRNSTVTISAGALSMNASGDFIQNGAPDGIALIDTSTNAVIDALSYEGSITTATITGFAGPVSLVEGSAFSSPDTNDDLNSLSRRPNGTDTDNAATDWALITSITPGAANPD